MPPHLERIRRRAAIVAFVSAIIIAGAAAPTSQTSGWMQWRGPFNTGMAVGDAPLTWSDANGIAWKVPVPGRGHARGSVVHRLTDCGRWIDLPPQPDASVSHRAVK